MSKERNLSRREFLKLGGLAALGVVTAAALEGCAPATPVVSRPTEAPKPVMPTPDAAKPRTPEEQKRLEEEQRKAELLWKAGKTSNLYKEFMSYEGATPYMAVTFTKAAKNNINNVDAVMGEYVQVVNTPNMNPDRAANVVASSRIHQRDIRVSLDHFVAPAAAHRSVGGNYDRAVDLAGMAQDQNRLASVLSIHEGVIRNSSVQKKDIPEVVLAAAINGGDVNKVQEYYKQTNDGVLTLAASINEKTRRGQEAVQIEGISVLNKGDVQAIQSVYEEFHTNSKLSEFSSKILTLAASLNGFKLNDLILLYNHFAQIPGIDQETVAQLVLETVSTPDNEVPIALEDFDEVEVADGVDQSQVGSSGQGGSEVHHGGGGSSVVIVNGGGGSAPRGTSGGLVSSPSYAPRTSVSQGRLASVPSRIAQGTARPSSVVGARSGPSIGGGRVAPAIGGRGGIGGAGVGGAG